MKKILIIETEYEGHYLTGYIKYILRSFVKKKIYITLLTSESALKRAKGAFKILKNENVKFSILVIKNAILEQHLKYQKRHNKSQSSLALFFDQINFYFIIKKEFKKINLINNYDHVFVPSIQKIDKAIALFGTPFQNTSFSGIYLDIKFHLRSFGISHKSRLNFFSQIFFKKLLNIENLKSIITNDHLLTKFLKKKNWKNYHKVNFLHDPKETNFKFKKNNARKTLGLPNKSIFILVYGALIDSKGIFELLSIFENNEVNKNIKIILAGKQFGLTKFLLSHNIFVKKLKLNTKLFIYNKWLTEEEEALFFSAVDIVWVGYKSYSSPSGVLYQAVSKSLPIITSDDGLICHLNKKIKIGISVNIFSPSEIIKAINYVTNKNNLLNLKYNIIKFSKISNPKNWILGFQKIHKTLYL
jgi:hypothetical protein